MRKHLILCVILVSVLAVRPGAAAEEAPTLTSGQMVVLNLIIHGVVNLYSTTNLIADSYTAGGIVKEDALLAVERNGDFLKVLTRYAMDIKRQGARGDKEMMNFLGSVTEVCTNLELHLGAVKSYIEKGDTASLTQVEKYEEKLEGMIDAMLKSL